MRKLFLLFFIAFMVHSVYAFNWNGVSSYWNFDRGTVGNITDVYSGTKNYTIFNYTGLSINYTCVSAQCYRLNITGMTANVPYINRTEFISTTTTPNGTVSYWAKNSHPEANLLTIARVNPGAFTYYSMAFNKTKLYYYVNGQVPEANLTIDYTQWHHFIMSWNTTGTNIYMDGSKIIIALAVPATGGARGDTIFLSQGNVPYDGLIDEMFYINRTITDNEASELYNYGFGLGYNNTIIAPAWTEFSGNDVNSTAGAMYELSNVTFYMYNATALIFQENKSISGKSNITSWSIPSTFGKLTANALTCSVNTTVNVYRCGLAPTNATFQSGYSTTLTYQPLISEGLTQSIIMNVSYDPSQIDSVNAYLIYNGTSYSATKTGIAGNYTFTTTLVTPLISSGFANVSFQWSITLQNATYSATFLDANGTQTIYASSLDDCSTYSNLVANFTFYDEDSRTQLLFPTYNLTAQIEGYAYSDTGLLIANVSFNRTNMNSVSVCLSNVSATPIYFYSTVHYGVLLPATYVTEYHNIQNFPVTTTLRPGNISLYPLLTTSSVEFLITVKDTNYITIANALVDIRRRYVSPATPISVEIPKTDSDGSAIGHFVLNDFRYDFVISKNNVTLYTFQNMQPFCEDVATGNCQFELKIPSDSTRPVQSSTPIEFSFSYDANTRVISIPWNNNDAQQHTLYLNVTSIFNNTEYCPLSTSTGFSGSLICTVPSEAGNGTVIVHIQEGDLIYFVEYLDLSGAKMPFNILTVVGAFLLIGVLVFIALPTGIIPTLIMFCVGMVLAVSTGMLGGGSVIGTSSAVVWFIIAALILIWRASKNERV